MPVPDGAIPTPLPATATADDIRNGRAFLALALLVLAFGLVAIPGLGGPAGHIRGLAFGVSLIGVLALFASLGEAVTGYWSGILINGRQVYSLVRAQTAAWSCVVLSALLAAVACNLWNIGGGAADAFDITIPQNLLVMLGITGASLAASPAALALRAKVSARPGQVEVARARLNEPSIGTTGLVITRTDPARASWLDMIEGDEVANAGTVDLAKVQHLVINTMLIVGYAVLVARAFALAAADSPIGSLPDFSPGFAWLLGISNGAYLAYRAAPKSAAGPDTITG